MAANRQPLPARLMRTLEDATALDRGVDFLEPAAEGLTADQNVKDALRGEKYLGSPLHPALVHFPIGFAYAAAVVDLLGRFSRPGATVLTAATVACGMPTALSGLADWSTMEDDAARRVGVVHAAAAATGSSLAAASLVCRLGRKRGAARALLWGACAAYGAAGYLGGHLVYGSRAAEDVDLADAHAEVD